MLLRAFGAPCSRASLIGAASSLSVLFFVFVLLLFSDSQDSTSTGNPDLDLLCGQCQQRLSHGHHVTNSPAVRADDLSNIPGYVRIPARFSLQTAESRSIRVSCVGREVTRRSPNLNRIWPHPSALSAKLALKPQRSPLAPLWTPDRSLT